MNICFATPTTYYTTLFHAYAKLAQRIASHRTHESFRSLWLAALRVLLEFITHNILCFLCAVDFKLIRCETYTCVCGGYALHICYNVNKAS